MQRLTRLIVILTALLSLPLFAQTYLSIGSGHAWIGEAGNYASAQVKAEWAITASGFYQFDNSAFGIGGTFSSDALHFSDQYAGQGIPGNHSFESFTIDGRYIIGSKNIILAPVIGLGGLKSDATKGLVNAGVSTMYVFSNGIFLSLDTRYNYGQYLSKPANFVTTYLMFGFKF